MEKDAEVAENMRTEEDEVSRTARFLGVSPTYPTRCLCIFGYRLLPGPATLIFFCEVHCARTASLLVLTAKRLPLQHPEMADNVPKIKIVRVSPLNLATDD